MEWPMSVILMSNDVEQIPAHGFDPLRTNVDLVRRHRNFASGLSERGTYAKHTPAH